MDPTLCPAFRVRRGGRSACSDMTGYIGSRASGYPPDFVPFRLHLGASSTVLLRCARQQPFGSLGRAVRECPEVGPVPLTVIGVSSRDPTCPCRKAAPTRATPNK